MCLSHIRVAPFPYPLFLGSDFEAGAGYIKAKFLSLNHSKLPIYPHYTCATDTHQIETVFAAVKETILAKALKDTGIL